MIKVESFLNNSLILFLILLSGSIFHVGFFTPTYLLSLILVVVSLFYTLNYSRKQITLFVFSLFFWTTIFASNFIFSISNNFKDYSIILMQSLLSLLFILSFKLRKADFKYHLYSVLLLLMILSLIGFILSVFQIGTRVDIGDSGFSVNTIGYIFYYSAEMITEPITLFRSQGVFWEAGLLAIYANIFLFLSLFTYNNRRNSILAIFCIITSLSTTGFLLLGIQLFVYLRRAKLNIAKKIYLILTIIPIAVFFVFSFLSKQSEGEDRSVSSYALRTFDLYSGTMVTLSHPLFGVGLNKEVFLKERNKFLPKEMEEIFSLIEDRGNTNSILMLFTSMGIFLGIFILYMFYRQDVFLEQNKLFFLIMVLGLTSEPVLLSPFFMSFIFFGFQKSITNQ